MYCGIYYPVCGLGNQLCPSVNQSVNTLNTAPFLGCKKKKKKKKKKKRMMLKRLTRDESMFYSLLALQSPG